MTTLDNVANKTTGIAAVAGIAIAQFLESVYGAGVGRVEVIGALLGIIALDWITGIAASIKDKTYLSMYGINGILRTIFIMVFPFVATLLDKAFDTSSTLYFGVTIGLIWHTWQSATANAVRAGWEKWIPDLAIKMVSSEIQQKAKRAATRRDG